MNLFDDDFVAMHNHLTSLGDPGAVDVIWSAVTYKGIFHNEYEAAVLFSGEIESKNPYVEVREADFSAITHSDTVTINSTVYHITNPKPDGTGMMILELSKI